MPQHISLIDIAHKRISARLCSGSYAIDATVGNGYDTVFLAQQVGINGKVYGFDIQQCALLSAQSRLQQAMLIDRVTLFQSSHEFMYKKIAQHQHGRIAAVMFNLGYLPGSNKSIMTQSRSTIAALSTAVQLISVQGLISVIAYPGHKGGDAETDAVESWCNQLDNRFVFNTQFIKDLAPRLFTITKIR